MPHIIGLSMLLLWAYGLFTPYTLIGFIEILVITSFLNLILKKILKMNFIKAKQDNSTSVEIN
jgi:hypothetical protein